MMALSIGELMHEAGKLLPKRNSLYEEESEEEKSLRRMLQYESPVERPVMLASFNQEPITTVSNAPQPPICNLKYTAATAQLMNSKDLSLIQPTVTSGSSTIVPPPIRRPSQQQQSSGQSKPLHSSTNTTRLLSGYQLLQSKIQFPQASFSTTRPTFPHRRRKSRGLGTVSKQTQKLIRETNKGFSKKPSEQDVSHPVTKAVQSLTKLEQKSDTEISLKKENVSPTEEEEKQDDEDDYADELDDIVPPLESDICPSSPVEVEKMKRTIHRRSSLYLDVELVNFGMEMNKKTRSIVNKFRGGVVHTLEHIGDDVREDYELFLNELDDVVFYAYRQAERILQDYSPRTIVLISSAVPKAEMLLSAVKPGVLGLIYDVATETYTSLLEKIKVVLNKYKMGAKAKHLAFVCKGGPGYMYLIKSNPITPVRLMKEEQLLKFWKTLGSYMSKLTLKDPSVIHIMESNVAGTPQGTELLSNLEAAMFCHQVKVESPLELEPKGREMISIYFQPEKFSSWKSRRYSKFRLYKI